MILARKASELYSASRLNYTRHFVANDTRHAMHDELKRRPTGENHI